MIETIKDMQFFKDKLGNVESIYIDGAKVNDPLQLIYQMHLFICDEYDEIT